MFINKTSSLITTVTSLSLTTIMPSSVSNNNSAILVSNNITIILISLLLNLAAFDTNNCNMPALHSITNSTMPISFYLHVKDGLDSD